MKQGYGSNESNAKKVATWWVTTMLLKYSNDHADDKNKLSSKNQ